MMEWLVADGSILFELVNRSMENAIIDFQFVTTGGREIGDIEDYGSMVGAGFYRADRQAMFIMVI
jgi:hypothetical protein